MNIQRRNWLALLTQAIGAMAICAVVASARGALAADAAEANLLTNPDFHAKTEAGMPVGWTIGKGQKVSLDTAQLPAGMEQALRVEVVADGGSGYGQVYQTVKVKPNTLYRLEGKTRSSKAGMAFYSIKLLKGGHEAKRIGLEKSKDQWASTSLEISTGDADEMQVLCRWEQNEKRGWVGQTCWFADVKLVEKGAAPKPPAQTTAIELAGKIQAVEAPTLPLKASAGDLFITPSGAGKKDGSGWENALPGNAPGVFQAAWDALGAGHACKVGSGVYANVSLNISTGGTGPDQLKRLVGQDTGGGLPWLVGNFDPQTPDKGLAFLNLTSAVGYCAFEDLQLARYQYGMFSRKGGHVGMLIRNVDVYEARYGMYLVGFAYADAPDAASHQMTIQDCEFIHFTKSAIRMQAGNYDVRIINCVADAGGTEWMKEAFHTCYNLAGDLPRKLGKKEDKEWAAEHDILFINCIARNAIYSKARYWQGDGFLAEKGVRNLAFINCASYNNGDGGWDNKAANVVYVNCIGMRSKMNWRVWHQGFFYNCLDAYAIKRGGSWTGAGLWTLGEVHALNCTFHNNESRNICADNKKHPEDPDAAEARANVSLEKCIVSFDGMNAKMEHLLVGETQITQKESAEWLAGAGGAAGKGTDPQFVAAAQGKNWIGDPADAFDSKLYRAGKGFHSAAYVAWRGKSTQTLVEAGLDLLKHKGWEDFRQKVEAMTGRP